MFRLFRNEKFILILIFFAALSLRMVVALSPTQLYSDDMDYSNIAKGIIDGKGFVSDVRHPVYPFFIALIYMFTKSSILAVKITQAFLGAGLSVIVYFISKSIFKKIRLALVPGIAVALYPFFIIYTGRLFSENLQIFLMALCFLFVLKNYDTPGLKNKICIGVFFGLSVLTKAFVAPFLPLLLLWMMMFSKQLLKYRLKEVFIVLFVVLLTLMPWVIRNYVVYRSFILTSPLGGECFYAGNTVQFFDSGLKDPQKLVMADAQTYKETEGLLPAERNKYFYKKAFSYIIHHPKETIKLQSIKLLRLWHLWPDNPQKVKVYSMARSYPDITILRSDFLNREKLINSVKIFYHLCYNIFFAGMFFGLFCRLSEKQEKAKILLLFSFVWVVSFIIIFAYMGGVRYRLFLDPYVFIMGWYGIFYSISYLFNRAGFKGGK